MNLLQTILNRRSIRRFTAEPVAKEKILAVVDAALLAPTSRNRRPCEFFVVQDKAALQKLSKAKSSGSALLAECPCAIVVAADSTRADTWVEDSSVALSYMWLAAVEQNLAGCWVQFHLRSNNAGTDSEALVRSLLALGENWRIVGALALGYAAEPFKPHTPDEAERTKIHWL